MIQTYYAPCGCRVMTENGSSLCTISQCLTHQKKYHLSTEEVHQLLRQAYDLFSLNASDTVIDKIIKEYL